MTAHGTNNWGRTIYGELPQSPGIYIIWFDGMNRAYIGGSINVRNRVKTHIYEMQVFKSHKMHDDLNRCTPQRLRAAVLCQVNSRADLPSAETYHIGEYRRGGWQLYNTDSMGKFHRDWLGAQQ